jgi:hypothetical protein
METHISPQDSLWKELLTEFHSDAILFFFGRKLYNAIDFSVPPEFLEQEFNDAFAVKYPTKKIADKIIKYRPRYKNFDVAKLFRLLNFVQYLVTLPPNLEELYQNFIIQPQIQVKMEFSKEFLQLYAQPAIQEVQDEALEKGIEKGIEKMIMDIHNKMGFNAQQIANITSHEAEYIQTVLDKYYKNNPK